MTSPLHPLRFLGCSCCLLSEVEEFSTTEEFNFFLHLQRRLSLCACRLLSLSTNMVDKITGLSGMKNLRILSLGRNYIKQISGLEAVGETLEELWLSYNLIEKLKGLAGLKKLRVLYLSNNQVKDWAEFNRLQELPSLENLLFIGNPLVEGMDEALWKAEITKVTAKKSTIFIFA